jgi:hypothetical protein
MAHFTEAKLITLSSAKEHWYELRLDDFLPHRLGSQGKLSFGSKTAAVFYFRRQCCHVKEAIKVTLKSFHHYSQVVYETKASGDDLMMSGSEVIVANEEEVGEHEQVTIHYISADGGPGNFFGLCPNSYADFAQASIALPHLPSIRGAR